MPKGYVDEPIEVATGQGFVDEPLTSGPITPGNIDLYNRPPVQNPDGSTSTVRSMSFEQDGKEILIPTVVNGRVVSNKDAIAHYRQTGEHLGIFPDAASATAYAEQLHNEYAGGKYTVTAKHIAPAGAERETTPLAPPPEQIPHIIGHALPPAQPDLARAVTPTDGALDPAAAWKAVTPGVERPNESWQQVVANLSHAPIVGQFATGVEAFHRGLAALDQLGDPERVAAREAQRLQPGRIPAMAPDTKAAVSDVLEGGFGILTPVLAQSAVVAPLRTAIYLGQAVVAQKLVESAIRSSGGSDTDARLYGNVAALMSGVASEAAGKGVVLATDAAKAGGRALVLSTKLSGSGYGPGDVPGFRSNPFADEPAARPPYSEPIERLKQELVEFETTRAPIEAALDKIADPTVTIEQIADEILAAREPDLQPAASAHIDEPLEGFPSETALAPTPQLALRIGNSTDVRAVQSLEEAAQIVDQMRDRSGLGGSEFPETIVIDTNTGEPVARIAYNGRIFGPGAEDWKKGDLVERTDGRGFGKPAPIDYVDEPLPAEATPVAPAIEKPPIEANTYKFSSTQVNLPTDIAEKVTALGKKVYTADLAGDGREPEPHITVKYGLHTSDVDEVRKVLADEPPITVTLGKTSMFPPSEHSDGAATLKIDVDSPDLHRLNKKIADALEHTDSFPDYKPHATIAYVKPDQVKKYVGDDSLEGQQTTIDRIRFSGKDGSQVDVMLTGKQSTVAATKGRLIPTRRADGTIEYKVERVTERPATESLTPAAEKPSVEADGRQPERDDSAPVAGQPADAGEGAPGDGATAVRAGRRGTPRAGRGDAGDSAGPAPGPGAGTEPTGVDAPQRRGQSKPPVAVPTSLSRPTKTGRDYRITDADELGRPWNEPERIASNLAALTLLKQLDKEGRKATSAEQKVLVRYVGWGGLSNAFRPYGPLEHVYKELQALLSEEDFARARGSTLNAHYTSPEIIGAMYDAVKRLRFAGGRVLEPATGAGHFFGLMPPPMAARSTFAGVELDPITARLAQQLYQSAQIQAKGFEKSTLPDNFFDLVISNVPFGKYGVHDVAFTGRPKALTSAIHNYFFAKALDKVRPGGLVAFITSRYTLDAQSSVVRKYLASQAELLGAIRLPETAFRKNANTDVVTDVLFLKKRETPTTTVDPWVNVGTLTLGDHEKFINQYFIDHPEMVLGTHALARGMYGPEELTVQAKTDTPLLDQFAAAVKKLPKNAITTAEAPSSTTPTIEELIPAPDHVKENGYAVQDGTLYVRERGKLKPLKLPPPAVARIVSALEVRDRLRDAMRTMLDPEATDATVSIRQQALNKAYDAFVKKHGYLSTRANVGALGDDPDKPLLLALEHWDADTQTAKKAAIFSKRTLTPQKPVTSADSPKAAMLVSLNELGRVDFERMTALTGETAAALQDELRGMVFLNPSGAWETAEEYLSGNVRQKLAEADAAAALDGRYRENVEALTAVQPADLGPADIDVRLGASWVPAEDVRDFIGALLDAKPHQIERISVRYIPPLAAWTIKDDVGLGNTVAATSKWGTRRANAMELLEQALNLKQPTIKDRAEDKEVVNQTETLAAREKLQAIKDEFKKWIWQDDARASRLAQSYNTQFNNLRIREYDGSHLTLPGMSAEVQLRPHQKHSIWRVLQSGNTGLGHVVGAGKTYVMAGAAMESRRLGLAKKPMLLAKNGTVEQIAGDFQRLYPAAKLLVTTKDDFAADKRKKLVSRIATGDWDAVILAHSSFGKIPISDEAFETFMQRQLDELEAYLIEAKAEEGKRGPTVKQLERSKKNLEAKLESRRNAERQDKTLSFEETGIDMLIVDEADLFKNLFFPTKMTRVAGLPNTESDRSFDMFLKTQHVQQVTNGRGVVFATATPISNSMAEVFTMQRYLQLPALEAAGLAHFDAWAQQFGETVQALELAPEGTGYRSRTRFARFSNLPELVAMFRQVWDIKLIDDLPDVKALLPKLETGKPIVVAVPSSEELKIFVKQLAERADAIRGGKVKPDEDNMLKVTGEGRKAALDMRLVLGLGYPADPEGKIAQAAIRITAEWTAFAKDKGTQLVFSDIGTPNSGDRFDVYAALRDALVDHGIPKAEIAFIHDYDTEAKLLKLYRQVNKGEVRVLMGSTEKLGAGVNVQERLVAQHHLDAPWRPRDVEQRDGRIVRQGNSLQQKDPNFTIKIYRYVTEGSFDAYSWQTLETKKRFIDQVMNGKVAQRSAEDVEGGALTYAEVKALASGNPAVLEKVKADTAVRKYSMLKAAYDDQLWRFRSEKKNLPERITGLEHSVAHLKALIAARAIPEPFSIQIGKTTYDEHKPAGEALVAKIADVGLHDGTVHVGRYANLTLSIVRQQGIGNSTRAVAMLQGGDGGAVSREISAIDPVGTIRTITHLAATQPELNLAYHEKALAADQQRLVDVTAELGKPFEHEAALREALRAQASLEKALDLDSKGQQQEGAAVPDEGATSPERAESGDDSGGSASSMQSAVIPGLKEFVEQDLMPGGKDAAETVVAASADIRNLFAPQATSTAARDFSHLTRTHLAVRDQRSERARRATKAFAAYFDRALRGAKTDAQKANVLLRFTDAVEGGDLTGLSDTEQDAARLFRELLDARRTEIQRLGRLENYIANYFPHEWADPSAAKNALLRLFGKRPLQGPKSFLKKRSIPTVREGIEKGLVPASYNPVELVLRKLVEMDKFIAATRILQDGQRQSLAAYVPIGTEPPEGWQRFDGSFGTVYGKPVVEVKEAYDPVVRDGLTNLLKDLRVHHARKPRIGGRRWGYAEGDASVVTKFAGPEGVLMHELGHVLDERYGLRDAMVKDKRFKQELRDLADLRDEGDLDTRSDYRKHYVRKGEEKIANLVHAYLYLPDRAKKIAPNSYWFLHKVIKANPELRGLVDIQKAKSLKLAVGTAEIPVGGAVIKGYYYGPPEVVRLLRNHLAPGLRSSTAFNLYRRAGNFMNSIQLGLSAFHMTMTGLESVISKQSLALELLARGEVGAALRKQLEVPLAPLIDLRRGHVALRTFYAQDANAQTIDDIIHTVVQGGGGFGWSLFEHEGAPATLMQALRQGNYPGALLRGVPALIELQAKPIMEGWVPRLKMAAYLDLMEMEMRSLGDEPKIEEVRRLAADAWDSIDNRFGQLRYDNLFWHTALKDLGMASVRALGWNVGSVREAFGAPGAQLRQLGVLPGGGFGGRGGGGRRPIRLIDAGLDPEGNPRYEKAAEPWLHRKLAWLISTVLIYGLLGATYEYLHTGQGPKELKDYFFPHDRNGQRVSIPGYFKDWYEFFTHPVRTVTNKANPLLSLLVQLWNDEDYYGTQIVDWNDDRAQQLTDFFDYLAKEFQPFSLRSFQQTQTERVGSKPAISAAESFLGVNRAPKAVTETAAEAMVRRFNPPQGRTKSQAADAARSRAIREGLQAKTPEGRAHAAAAIKSGELSAGQIQAAVRGAQRSRLQASVRSLTLDQALRVYEVATPDERRELRSTVLMKGLSLAKVAPADREALRLRYKAALALPYGGTPSPAVAR